MAIGKKRQKQIAEKNQRKAREMSSPGGKSRYAKKKEYLATRGINWGFEVPEPKPWR